MIHGPHDFSKNARSILPLLAGLMALFPALAFAATDGERVVNPTLMRELAPLSAQEVQPIVEFLREAAKTRLSDVPAEPPVAKPVVLEAAPAPLAPALPMTPERLPPRELAKPEPATPSHPLAMEPVAKPKPPAPPAVTKQPIQRASRSRGDENAGSRGRGVAARLPEVREATLPSPALPKNKTMMTEVPAALARDLPPSLPALDEMPPPLLAPKAGAPTPKMIPLSANSPLIPPSQPVRDQAVALPKNLPQLAALPAPKARPVRISTAQFTRGLAEMEPTDNLSRVSLKQDEKLIFFTRLEGLSGKMVTHRWIQDGRILQEKRYPVASNDWRVWSQLWLRPEYHGRVSVDVLGENGSILESASITIED